MKKYLLTIIIFLSITNCTLNKVVKHHGVHNLKKKNDNLEVLITNRNDVISNLGNPSTKSAFDNDIWIYLERKITSSELKSLGTEKLLINDVLVLEFNTEGILIEKKLLTMDNMNDIAILEENTVVNRKNAFVQTFVKSLKQKINDPLGVKKAK